MWGLLSRWGGDLGLSLGCPQGIQTSLHLMRWKMSLHSSHCREIRPSFESGHLSVHSTWGSKLRVTLTYLLLREASSWGACGKLAYLFIQSQGITSHLEMIWDTWSFPRVAVLKLVFLLNWDGCLRVSLEFPKGSQATCHVWCGTQNGSRANTVESGFISSWFGVHWCISHSCGDISVLLDLYQCSWGLSGVPSNKSRLLTCLMGNMELLCTQCRGIGPHLMARGMSHGFSRVTVGIILQNSFSKVRTPVWLWRTHLECPRGLARQYGHFSRWAGRPSVLF